MNVQTDPTRFQAERKREQKAVLRFPAVPEKPIRGHFLPADRLYAVGEALASNSVSSFQDLRAFDFGPRIRENAERILAVYRATNAAQTSGEMITPAAQWLLDNNYLVEETIFQVKRDLPRRFYRELPTLELPDGKRMPRALALAWLYVAHCDSAVTAQSFRAIVEGYQSVEPLKIGELWALPSLLRFVLVENLRRLAVRVERARRLRQIANDVADRIAESADPRDALAASVEHAHDTTFATQLLFRLRDGSQNAGQALTWLEKELEKSGSDAEEIILAEHQTLSSGNVTTGNIIRGLRLINDIDWTVWFEEVSRVDALLRERSDLASLDFPSRDQYRSAIEDLARHSGRSEFEVASLATELAGYPAAGEAASGDHGGRAEDVNVGFFLVGSRREELERQIGYRATFGRRLNRAFRSTGWLGMVVPVFLLTVLLMVMTGSALAGLGLHATSIAILLLLFSVPASEGAMAFFNAVVLQFLKPTRLIGYEYKDGVPAGERTLVVVPALIGSRDDVDETIRNLEVHYLANSQGEVYFSLLSDWPDSDCEHSAADDQILEHARAEVARLNERYPRVGSPRFHLLHRRRLYNGSQGCWMEDAA
ncbi:MAG: Cellobiose phosphorylase [Rhizobiaceae bacterium]|nr:Cellobiose phosphorylase [Rhizobiaceae bacterium]